MNVEPISNARNPLLPAALAAIQRAAQRARREALATHTAIVISRQGRLVRLEEQDVREEAADHGQEVDRGAGQVDR